MHDALRQLLQGALKSQVGASVMVEDEALEHGGDEGFMHSLRRRLVNMLSDFIVANKVLDGTDPSGFRMQPDEKLAATRCEVRLYVMTPQELETLVKAAFDAGHRSAKTVQGKQPYYSRPFPGDYVPLPEPIPHDLPPELMNLMKEQWLLKPWNQGKTPPWVKKGK